jgi:carboxylesterase
VSSPEPAASARVDSSPFDLPGRGRAAALCLHGLTGTPYEVRPLGEALAAAGIAARGPALPGHNETPQRLARTTSRAWLEAARGHLSELRSRHEVVFLVGLSMGGLLTLRLASEEPVAGLAVVGVPLRLRHPVRRLVPLLKYVFPFPPKPGGSDIADPEARARHPSYTIMPLAAVHELIRLQRRVAAGLGRITAPILVAHGAHDQTADPADAREIFESVGSATRERLILESSAHVVPVDHDGPVLARAVVEFFARCAESPSDPEGCFRGP